MTRKEQKATTWPAVERRKSGWAKDWQSSVENDKAVLAQSLHDDTGGLLVAAVMDISWAESHIRGDPQQISQRLIRARSALEAAIDLNRRIIEDLHPTLLDNFGLIAALKWHMSEACKAAAIDCNQDLPDPSPDFLPSASIALYRIAQTLIALMVAHQAGSIELRLALDQDFVTLGMRCDGLPASLQREDNAVMDALASVTGRVKALGGQMQFDAATTGALVTCLVPVIAALRR